MNKSIMKTRFSFLIITVVFLLAGSSCSEYNKTKPVKDPQNIILFIGDGMGVTQLYAGMTVSKEPFNILKFPYSGLSITNSADNYVTDSGAGGTAIACGVKTNNGMIGVTPDKNPVPSITEIVRKNGLSTGIISTSSVTHATPASFVAHNSARGNYEDIALDFLNGTADVFIGGGEDHFRKRADGRDLTEDLKKQGYDIIYSLDKLKTSGSDKVAALLSPEHMPRASEGREGMLPEMVKKAIEILSRNEKGFFLMVEGSMIDWGGHANDIDYVTSEMIDMDQAVGEALKFAEENRKTLIVITSDHETGALSLPGGDIAEKNVIADFASTNHSGVMVPVFSFGPGAEMFSGIHENTFFLDTFLNLLKIEK